jgi:hypothetical protein
VRTLAEEDLAYQAGEKLTFTMHYEWGNIDSDVGTGTVVLDTVRFNGLKAFHCSVYGKTTRLFDLIFKVEDSHMLPLGCAIIATYAYVTIFGQVLYKIVHLCGQSLLQSEDGGLLLPNHIQRGVLAVVPYIIAISGARKAYVVRDYGDVVWLLTATRQHPKCHPKHSGYDE